MSGTPSPSEMIRYHGDLNPIFNQGFSKSAEGMRSAIWVYLTIGIDFKLKPLDCELFYHGYGELHLRQPCAGYIVPSLEDLLWN